MKVEAVGQEYSDICVNVNNEEVVFKNNIADVSDELGQFMIEQFPHFFPKGKVKIETQGPEIHVFDQTKYEEQAERIVKLNMIIKSKDQKIAELEGELKEWKRRHEELQEKFAILAKKDQEPKQESVKVEMEFKTEEDYRKQLEARAIEDLKIIASDLNVPLELVKKKSAKKSWVDAIIETTFKL